MYAFKKSLGFKLNRLGILVRRKLLKALTEWELTPEQWQVLSVSTVNQRGISAREISSVTLIDRHSISKLLDKLEARHWVSRQLNPEDTRSQLIMPSRELLREYPKMKRSVEKEFSITWASLGLDKNNFEILCTKLIDAME